MTKFRLPVIALLVISLGIGLATVLHAGSQDQDSPNFNGVFLLDRTGSHRVAVTNDGHLAVTGNVGVASVATIGHITSAVHVAGVIANREHVSGALRAWQVSSCGTTASLAVASNPDRRDLVLSNLAGAAANPQNVILYIGYGTVGHVALSTANGFALSVHRVMIGTAAVPTAITTTPPLVLQNYQGPVACITNTDTAIMSVIEILR